jgi:hypothetical protein
VPVGFILFETGIDLHNNVKFPASGLSGDLARLGTFGLSFCVSSIAEIQIDGVLGNRLDVASFIPGAPLALLYTGGTTTSAFGDIVLGAKIRLVSEAAGRPGLALRFASHLPFGDASSGLRAGTTNVELGLAAAKTVNSVRVVINMGMAALGDPERSYQADRVVLYGVSIARAVGPGVELTGEVNGRSNPGTAPAGTESGGLARVGGRFTRGPVRLDGGFLIGLTESDPSWGVTFGLTWVFRGFNVQ